MAKSFNQMVAEARAEVPFIAPADAKQRLDAHIARIQDVNPKLNAIVIPMQEGLRSLNVAMAAAMAAGEAIRQTRHQNPG